MLDSMSYMNSAPCVFSIKTLEPLLLYDIVSSTMSTLTIYLRNYLSFSVLHLFLVSFIVLLLLSLLWLFVTMRVKNTPCEKVKLTLWLIYCKHKKTHRLFYVCRYFNFQRIKKLEYNTFSECWVFLITNYRKVK